MKITAFKLFAAGVWASVFIGSLILINSACRCVTSPTPSPVPVSVVTSCASACAQLDHVGCHQHPNCPDALGRIEADRLERTASGAALTCKDIIDNVHTPADAPAHGVTCWDGGMP
jgi:hypothetical protein